MKNIVLIISLSLAFIQSNTVSASLDTNDQKAIIVEYSVELGLYVKHEVNPKETIYSLSKLSKKSADELCIINNISKDQPLAIGTSLIIPIDVNTIITDKSKLPSNGSYKNVLYKVKPKDNLFQIAKRYFNQEVNALKLKNNLSENEISPDQVLLVGWFISGNFNNYTPSISNTTEKENHVHVSSTHKGPTVVMTDDVQNTSNLENKQVIVEEVVHHVARTPQTLDEFQKETGFSIMPIDTVSIVLGNEKDIVTQGVKENVETTKPLSPVSELTTTTNTTSPSSAPAKEEIEEVLDETLFKDYRQTKGIALWDKTTEDSGKYFVLHRMAKVGSTMQVINPMLGRMVQAKVISNFPPNVYPDDVKLIVSSSIAKVLGVIDGRFLVEMKYLPNYK